MTISEISWNEEAEGASLLLEAPALADFKDVNGLAKAFLDTKTLVGNSLRLPSTDAGEEDKKAFLDDLLEKVPTVMVKPDPTDEVATAALHKSLGKPEESNGYVMPEVKDAEVSDDQKKFLTETAFESNMTQSQFESFVAKTLGADVESTTRKGEVQREEMQGLKQEWGLAFEDKSARVLKVAEATNAPPEVVKSLRENTAPVATIKWLDGLVKALGSEDFQIAVQPNGTGALTPDEARGRANEIRTKIHTMNQSDPDYPVLIKRMREFDQLAKAS